MKYLALLLPFVLGACATVQPQVEDASCTWVRPIYVQKNDVLTDKTARSILSHDNKWKQICGGKK
jgi:hypothetical protein